MRAVSLVLAFIVFQVFVLGDYTMPKAHAQSTGTCPSGQSWSGQLNRCVISIETTETKNEVLACQGLSGDEFKQCSIDIAKDKRQDKIDDGEIKEYEKEFQKGSGTKIAIPLAVSLITAYYLFLNKDKFKDCKSTSMWMLFGAGVVSFVGEISAQISYKTKMKDLEDKYKEKMKDYEKENKYEIMTENQKLAFDMLIEAEQARISGEEIRKGTYTLAALLYAATAATALYESIQTGFKYGEASCGAKKTSSTNAKKHYDNLALFSPEDFKGYSHVSDMNDDELLEVILRKVYSNIMPIAPVYANTIKKEDTEDDCDPATQEFDIVKKLCVDKKGADEDTPETNTTGSNGLTNIGSNVGNLASVGAGLTGNNLDGKTGAKAVEQFFPGVQNSQIGKKQMNFLDQALATPYIRAALATLLGLYANKLRKEAEDNIEIAKKRIEVLEKIRDEFLASGGAGFGVCMAKDRKDQTKPHCFCYLEDGSLDLKKSKLTACQKSFATVDRNKKASDYNKTYGAMDNTAKVCVSENNSLDTFCKCKTKKSSSGQGNGCMKISNNFSLSGADGSSWLGAVAAPADSLIGGNISGNELDTTDLNKKALSLSKKIEDMRKDPKYADTFKKVDDTKLKLEKAHANWYKQSFGNNTPKSLAGLGGNNSAIPTNVADVMKEAKETMKKASGTKYKAGGDVAGAGGEKKDGFDFDWGGDNQGGEGGVQIDEVAQVMDKNYAIKGDINNNPDVNIFKILSNRYQRSGLRRLFDADGKTTADEANATDINEN